MNTIRIIILTAILGMVATDLDAQTRRRQRPTQRPQKEVKEDQISFGQRLNYEIKLGNLGFGNSFSLSLKPSVGYKFADFFTGGIGSRIFYTYFNNPFPITDDSFFDYGGFGFARLKIGRQFYVQGEYNFQSFETRGNIRTDLSYPVIGGGYVSGDDGWSYGIELNFIMDDRARDFAGLLEYWISFSYNF